MDTTQNTNGITIRRLGPGDEAAIERLVELDSGRRPEGHLMGVEIEGRLLAVRSIETGATAADPFSRTAELIDLLKIRIDQMNGESGEGRKRRFRHRRAHARGALAGTPTRASSKLLTLPARLS